MVSDMARSLAFYRGNLGFDLVVAIAAGNAMTQRAFLTPILIAVVVAISLFILLAAA